jgi:hypothetical protein
MRGSEMRIRDVPLRIVRTRYKLLYFVVWFGLGVLLGRLVYPVMPEVLKVIVGNLAFIGLVVVALRSFRGASEPVEPPRAWWRMTGTVRSSIVVAVLLFLLNVISIPGIIGRKPAPTPVGIADLVLTGIEYLALVVLYINSAVRLHRSPDPIAQKPVTLAEPLKGVD